MSVAGNINNDQKKEEQEIQWISVGGEKFAVVPQKIYNKIISRCARSEEKPRQDYPIYMRDSEGRVAKYVSRDRKYWVLSAPIDNYTEIEYEKMSRVPYNADRGLFDMQPVWVSSEEVGDFPVMFIYRCKMAGDVVIKEWLIDTEGKYDIKDSMYIAPMTKVQLDAMPFMWTWCKRLFKETKNKGTNNDKG